MKKLICLLMSVCSTAALVVSCTPKESDNGFKPALDVNTECNLKLAGNYSNFQAMEDAFDRFNKYYPKVTLDIVKIDSYENSIGNVLDSKDKPNIFFSFPWMIGNEKYESVVKHMENLSDPKLNLNLSNIRPGLLTKDKDGNVLEMPMFTRTYGMFINNELFKKENLNVPTNYNELLTVCGAFKEKGYENPMMGYTLKEGNSWMNAVAYPMFLATLSKTEGAIAKANSLDPSAGEYMRDALTAVTNLISNECIDTEACKSIANNYEKVLERFAIGDVPMMICGEDTSSKKDIVKFDYSYAPIPLTSEGGYFADCISRSLSVNKNCENLDMTNEFMRFLLSENELNELAVKKLLLSPTKDYSFYSIYAPFGQVPQNRILYPEGLGVKSTANDQLKLAAFKVGKGEMTVQQAIDNYGKF